jgi:hypothetical protein
MCTESLNQETFSKARAAASPEDVAEVIATFGGRMVDVAHLGTKQRRRGRMRAGLLAGLGLAAMAGGLGLFAYESAQPWEAWEQAALEAAETGAEAPAKPGFGSGGLGLGLALLGLVPALMGLTRIREDEHRAYGLDSYEIGESHSARMTVAGDGLPQGGAFPLVQRDADGVQINFGPEMRGAVTLAGSERTFASLVETGSARTRDGHYQLTLPRGAKAVVEHGGLRFWVRAVDPAALELERSPMDGAFWGSVGGVGAVAGALIFLMNSIPDSMLGISFEEQATDARYARYLLLAEPTPEPEEAEVVEEGPSGEATKESKGARAPGEQGKMGKQESKDGGKRFSMKKRGDLPQLARNHSYADKARSAGILGVLAQQDPSIFASPYGGAFSSGAHDEDIFGNMMGREVGEAYGVGGLGIVGVGKGGDGLASGVIGLSTAGVLDQVGPGDGKSLVRHKGKSAGHGDRVPRGPRVRIQKPTTNGDIDKAMIRRIVRSHLNEVRSCYNAGLAKNPNLQGRVEVNFVILGSGSVGTSVVTGNGTKSPQVGKCIAKSVKRWKFPRRGGSSGAVTVKYPFNLTNS